jgi:hypothetical protein
MSREKVEQVMSKYVPQNAVKFVAHCIMEYKIHLTITAKRKTMLGNYRPPQGEHGHRITINGDLNPYAFLLTFVHELAHLVTYEKYKNSVKPHGVEWKTAFQNLMMPLLKHAIFPNDITEVIASYLRNPAASSCRDEELMRMMRKYDTDNLTTALEDLPDNSIFKVEDGRVFRKGEKLRKNFRCLELKSQRTYRISSLMPVYPL